MYKRDPIDGATLLLRENKDEEPNLLINGQILDEVATALSMRETKTIGKETVNSALATN